MITPKTAQNRPETTVNGGPSRRHSTLPSQAKWLQKTSKTTERSSFRNTVHEKRLSKEPCDVSYRMTHQLMFCGDAKYHPVWFKKRENTKNARVGFKNELACLNEI